MKTRRTTLALAVLLSSGLSTTVARAQDHVVPLAEVHRDLRGAAQQRAANLRDIQDLLSRPEAQKELAKAHLDSGKVEKALSFMSDEELTRLAARARSADADVQGGLLKTILAIIGAITVIIILIAVLA